MFWAVLPPIIRSAYKRIYSILYLPHRYRYLSLLWSWNSPTIVAGSSNGLTNINAVDIVVCAPDDGWRYRPKHVEQFPDINKLCKCCILLDIYWNC